MTQRYTVTAATLYTSNMVALAILYGQNDSNVTPSTDRVDWSTYIEKNSSIS